VDRRCARPLQWPATVFEFALSGWDPVEQPYGAPRRAGRHSKFGMEPVSVSPLRVGVLFDHFRHVLDEVFGQVADVPAGFLRSGQREGGCLWSAPGGRT